MRKHSRLGDQNDATKAEKNMAFPNNWKKIGVDETQLTVDMFEVNRGYNSDRQSNQIGHEQEIDAKEWKEYSDHMG